MLLRATALVAAVAAAACLPPQRPPIYRVDQRFALASAPAEIHAAPDAALVLAAATTVAFVPPDSCHADVAIDVDTAEPAADPSLICESAIGRLEVAALDAGYRVVSWRALDGDGPLLERAAAAGVDVVFMIDELTAGAPAHDLVAAASTAVTIEPGGPAVALLDPAATSARCASELASILRPELAVTVDVQLVAVPDGRVLWTYRHTRNPAGGREVAASRRYSATVGLRPEGQSTWKIVAGSLGLSIGFPTLLATTVVGATGDDVDPPRALYAGELTVLALGIYSLATINADTRWRYSPADDVVCLPTHLTAAADLSAAVAPDPTCDGRCRRLMDHVDGAVDELFADLLRLRATAARR